MENNSVQKGACNTCDWNSCHIYNVRYANALPVYACKNLEGREVMENQCLFYEGR